VLGTGAAGFGTGARLVCEGIRTYERDSLADVRVIAYASEESETLEAVAEQIQSVSP